jgi:beta-glucosidase
LKGFERVELNPGESKKVTISLPDTSLMYWHPVKNCWELPEGPISVEVGFSELDIRQRTNLLPLPSPTPDQRTNGVLSMTNS